MIGKAIQRRREKLDLTRVELAERAGIRRSQVYVLEQDTHPPNTATLAKIANALGCRVWQLLKEADL